MGDIYVVNVRGFNIDNCEGEFVYVGRGGNGFQGSILGNLYKIGRDGSRAEVIKQYKVWLWREYCKAGLIRDEVDRIAALVRAGKDVGLGCWCIPEPCHAEVIKALIEYLVKQ